MKPFLFLLFVVFSVLQLNAQIYYDEGPLYDTDDAYEDFTLIGAKWGKTSLTYYINNTSNSLTNIQRENAITSAFNTWSSNSVLTFTQVSSVDDADLIISWEPIEHGDNHPFTPGVLAHAFFPPQVGGVHLLGIDHTTDINAIMYPAYLGVNRTIGLDDCKAVWALYGFPYTIGGSSRLCDSFSTFTIDNLPSALTVEWSIDNSNLSIVSGQGTSSVTIQKVADGQSALTAIISHDGTVLSTLTKQIFAGTPPLGAIHAIAADGGEGYWNAGYVGNSIEINPAMHHFYDQFEYEIYRYRSSSNITLYRHFYTTSTSYEPILPSGWYLIKVKGISDCGNSPWSQGLFEMRMEDIGPNIEITYEPYSESLIIQSDFKTLKTNTTIEPYSQGLLNNNIYEIPLLSG